MQYAPPDRRHAVRYAPPARPTLRSVRLPLTEAAAKPLAMLRWVRPDQIVMLKLLRESRNKKVEIFVFTMGGLPQRVDIAMGSGA